LEKQTANKRLRPYEFSNYNKYTLERARKGRCTDKNGPAKAFSQSQLEIANYWARSTMRLGLKPSLDYIIKVTSHLGVEVPNHQI